MKTFKEFISESNDVENVQELFITRKSPEERKKEKIEKMKKKLVRLIQYADDPHSDVALRKSNEA